LQESQKQRDIIQDTDRNCHGTKSINNLPFFARYFLQLSVITQENFIFAFSLTAKLSPKALEGVFEIT
jgi:hypothetical protein